MSPFIFLMIDMLAFVMVNFSNSPMRYPSPIYSGPPIPLNFGDSSFESSPEKPKARYI